MNHLKQYSLVLLGLILLLPTLQATPSSADKEQIDTLKKSYPLTTCVVSGEKLETSSMGEPVDYLYKTKGADGKETTRLIRLCCPGCIKKFKADPEKYLKILDANPAKGPKSACCS